MKKEKRAEAAIETKKNNVCMCARVCTCEGVSAHADQWSLSSGTGATLGLPGDSKGPQASGGSRDSAAQNHSGLNCGLPSPPPAQQPFLPLAAQTSRGVNKGPLEKPVELRVGISPVSGRGPGPGQWLSAEPRSSDVRGHMRLKRESHPSHLHMEQGLWAQC